MDGQRRTTTRSLQSKTVIVFENTNVTLSSSGFFFIYFVVCVVIDLVRVPAVVSCRRGQLSLFCRRTHAESLLQPGSAPVETGSCLLRFTSLWESVFLCL